jgi:hypothetical protein
MTQQRVDLASIFQTVTHSLAQGQGALNQADEYNKDHGDNMVQTFQTITSALQAKKGKSDSAALTYAAKQLAKTTTSGSGKLYAQGLAQAATQFKGKQVDSRGALQLLQTLISGEQPKPQTSPQTAGDDMLATLLGGLTGGGSSQTQQSAQGGEGDMLATLLGGLAGDEQPKPQADAHTAGGDILSTLLGELGGGAPSQSQPAPTTLGGDMLNTLLGELSGGENAGAGASSGLDMGDLLNVGMSFLKARQGGGNTGQALVQAFMAASGMGSSAHRTQSTQTVVSSFLQALGAASSKG